MKNLMLCGAAILLMMPGAAFAEQGAVEGAVLHIEALGEVPPDMATITHSYDVGGATQGAADVALGRQEAEIAGKLRALGVAAGDMQWQPAPSQLAKQAEQMRKIYADNAAREVTAAAAGLAGPPTSPRFTPILSADQFGTAASLVVTVRNLAKLGSIATAMQSDNQTFAGIPRVVFAASDPASAHAGAVTLALEHVRAEAESYAAAMHRHVGAVLRVANTKPGINLSDITGAIAKIGLDGKAFGGLPVSTAAAVQVDYQLLP